MKGILLIALAGVVVSGCEQKPDARDARIAALEARVTQDEKRFQDHMYESELSKAKLSQDFTNLMDMSKELQAEYQTVNDAVLSAVTSAPPARVTATRVASTTTRAGGIPATVYAAIRESAEKKWPGDYPMQEFSIKQQVEAYTRMHP